MAEVADIAVIGAGAAGLMAAISAGRRTSGLRIIAVDGARRLGAKILVAGGGRCNVTHHAVDESAYAGSSREQIRRVLRRFDVPETIRFFRELGVELKREETGKLFPVSDDAQTVLDALLTAARQAAVELWHPWRVASVSHDGEYFVVQPETPGGQQELHARAIILATGGKSLPKTGSDGHGHLIAKSLGHTITPRVFPALVPLTLDRGHFVCALSGLTLPATVEVRSGTGKRLASFTNSTLCTHFGLSGPSVLDISRYYLDAIAEAREKRFPLPVLTINWMPDSTPDEFEAEILEAAGKKGSLTTGRVLRDRLPERLIAALASAAGIDIAAPLSTLSRQQRRTLVETVTQLPLPVTGDRGFLFAEVTAGGVPLDQLNLKTMESRRTPGLSLCGEICDVDGRIGGFNFQWSWASGFVAGTSAADAISKR